MQDLKQTKKGKKYEEKDYYYYCYCFNYCNINAINMNIIPIFVVYLVFLTNY